MKQTIVFIKNNCKSSTFLHYVLFNKCQMKTMRGLFKLKIIQYQKNKKSNDVEILISENRTTLIDAVNIKPSLESWTVKKIYSLVKTSKKSQLMTCISCRRKTKRCHQSFAKSGTCIYNIIPFYASCHFNAFHYSASSHKWKPYTFTNLQTEMTIC